LKRLETLTKCLSRLLFVFKDYEVVCRFRRNNFGMSGLTGTESPSEVLDNGARALKLQTDTPHLVNIGGDRLSTSVTLHPIPQGSGITVY
jgi:hypothetical protein